MSDSDFDIAVVVGFGAGIFWFFKGFKVYREYRVLADTPEMPIRSIPMGLVEIHGKAKPAADPLVDSPVSQTPCLFYKVDIERYERDSKGRSSWRHYKTDCNGVPFYVDDGTGKALVHAQGAELDLIRTAHRDTGSMFPSSGEATAAEMVSYALSVRSPSLGEGLLSTVGRVASNGVSLGKGGTGRYRFTESLILPDHWYDITGTCVENPSPRDEHDRNMIVKGQNEPTFLISWRSEKEIEGTLRKRAAFHIFGGAALSIGCLGILLFRLGLF